MKTFRRFSRLLTKELTIYFDQRVLRIAEATVASILCNSQKGQMNNGPILIADDDRDDREFLLDAWTDLPFENPLIFFDNGQDVLDYLTSQKETPFLIL